MENMLRVVNLERGYPTVKEAIKKLDLALYNASMEKVKVMRIIHGYGSRGRGGKIKEAVTKYLQSQVKRDGISGFINGECWTIFSEKTREFLETCDFLKRDQFLDLYNRGITYVLL